MDLFFRGFRLVFVKKFGVLPEKLRKMSFFRNYFWWFRIFSVFLQY